MATKAIPVAALDCGHGLNTPGKQTPDGIKEWSINDDVRDRVVDNLKDYEIEFIFTDNDEGVVDEGLSARKAMYLNEKVDVAISIHHNAYTSQWNQATGVEVFADKKATAKDMELANLIYDRMVKYTGLKGRGVKKSNFTVINQNTIPAVLVEGGFMDSTIDHPVITSDAGKDAYARAISESLIEFLDLKKKPVDTPVSTPTNGKFKAGDVVEFTGTKHFTSANGDVSSTCKPGKATITKVVEGTKHPYHCKSVDNTSTVYGWVNEADIKGATVTESAPAKKPAETTEVKKEVKYKMNTLRKGSTGTDVYVFESLMRKMGFYKGAIDGDFGKGCVDATNDFQEKYPECGTNGEPDGIWGSKCWAKALSIIG